MKIYFNGTKISRNKAERLFNKDVLNDRILEAEQYGMFTKEKTLSWNDGLAIKMI